MSINKIRPTKPKERRRTRASLRECRDCGEYYPVERANLGYYTCMACGDERAAEARASWTVAPMHKSNYLLITSRETLKQLNPKRTN